MPKEFVAEINPEVILDTICEALILDPVSVKGSRLFPYLADARSIAAYLIRRHSDLTLLETAHFMKRTNHSAIIYSLKRFDDLSFGCKDFRSKVEQVKLKLKARGYDC